LKTLRVLVVACVLATLAACGDSGTTPPPPPTVTGTWTGFFTTAGGAPVDVSLLLTESSGQITGSGTFAVGSAGALAFNITGVHSFPSMSITMTSSGLNDANYAGTVDPAGTTINGTLNGSGFVNQSLTLTKP